MQLDTPPNLANVEVLPPEEDAITPSQGLRISHDPPRRPTERHVVRVRERLVNLRQVVDDSYVEIGVLLREVHQNQYFSRWGFDSFDAYVEAELRVRRRKAYYLLAVAETFTRLAITPEERRGITLSNARELAAATRNPRTGLPQEVTPERREELLEQARTMSSRDLRNSLRQERGLPAVDLVQFACAISNDQKLVIDQALETCRRRAEAREDELPRGRLLELVCAEFLAGAAGYVVRPQNVQEAPRTLDQLLTHLEAEVEEILALDPTGQTLWQFLQVQVGRFNEREETVTVVEEPGCLPGLEEDHDSTSAEASAEGAPSEVAA